VRVGVHDDALPCIAVLNPWLDERGASELAGDLLGDLLFPAAT
jgi:hypothetical protein